MSAENVRDHPVLGQAGVGWGDDCPYRSPANGPDPVGDWLRSTEWFRGLEHVPGYGRDWRRTPIREWRPRHVLDAFWDWLCGNAGHPHRSPHNRPSP